MRAAAIDNALFRANRERLAALLPPGSIAVLHSNDLMPTSADGTLPFVQQTDLFYLSGIDQEETVLLLFPAAPEAKHREALFLRETSPDIAQWEGQRLTREAATACSGIATVYWTREFERVFRPLAIAAETIYLNSNEHARAESPVQTRDERFRRWCQQAFPLHRYGRLAPLLHRLRPVKQELELAQIRQAIAIAEQTFRRLLGLVRPGVWEFEVEAAIWHELLRRRARRPSFAPIIASGADCCVLHYVKNDKQMQSGDLVLMDFGAEYANYASDITRTVPVSGRFSPRQRQVYEAVLRVQRGTIQAMLPGTTLEAVQQTAGKLVERELVGLNLLSAEQIAGQPADAPLYKRWFMHGVSHHLGLDVHDYGERSRPLEPGMVITCEPGIYIREEGIGIRLENDILITASGPLDLCASIPIEPDEIEALMQAAADGGTI